MKRLLATLFFLMSVACTTTACGVGDTGPIEYDCELDPTAPGCPPIDEPGLTVPQEYGGTWTGRADSSLEGVPFNSDTAVVDVVVANDRMRVEGLCSDGSGTLILKGRDGYVEGSGVVACSFSFDNCDAPTTTYTYATAKLSNGVLRLEAVGTYSSCTGYTRLIKTVFTASQRP